MNHFHLRYLRNLIFQDLTPLDITKGQKIAAIEVKSGKRQTALSGLEMFKKEYKTYRVITVGSYGIALEKFLETPILEWFN